MYPSITLHQTLHYTPPSLHYTKHYTIQILHQTLHYTPPALPYTNHYTIQTLYQTLHYTPQHNLTPNITLYIPDIALYNITQRISHLRVHLFPHWICGYIL